MPGRRLTGRPAPSCEAVHQHRLPSRVSRLVRTVLQDAAALCTPVAAALRRCPPGHRVHRAAAPGLAALLLALCLVPVLSLPLAAQSGAGVNATAPATTRETVPQMDTTAPAVTSAERVSSAPGLIADPGWQSLAERAERVLDAGHASDRILEQLRAELAEWRSRFVELQSADGARLEALRSQIAALGPAPAEGASEAPEIALRRTELDAQIARLEAPRRAAEEAYSRADALIHQIDSLLRERIASELLRLGPTPLNPAVWPMAARQMTTTLTALVHETATIWSDAGRRAALVDNLPVILGMVVAAWLALFRLPRLLNAGMRRLARNRSAEAVRLLDFGKSLLRLAGVLGGLTLLHAALLQADMTGFRGTMMVDYLWYLGVAIACAAWLGPRLFPRGEAPDGFFRLPPPRMSEARSLAVILAVMVWAVRLVASLAQLDRWEEGTRAVAQFPVLLVAGLLLFRLGQLIAAQAAPGSEAQPGQAEFRSGLITAVGRLTQGLGVLGPLLGAVGYLAAATYLTVPMTLTLALIGLLVVLQGALRDLYGVLTGKSGAALDAALVPVLAGILLAMAALPLVALIWGARLADLSEIWLRLRDGFSLGGTRISAGMFLSFVVVFLIGYGITRLLQGTLRSTVLPKTRIDPGGQTALVKGLGYLGIVLSAVFAITSAGMDLSSLAVVFGALSVGIGFGLQNIVQNFVSGIIMLVERPVAVGDWIETGTHQGIVKEISVRSTRIETFDRTSVIVPNANFISGTVTNWTRASLNGRISVPVTVTYASDTRQVEALLREIVEAHPLVMLNPKPSVTLENFGPSGIDFMVRAILPNINLGGAVRSELRHTILERFRAAGISMPGFPVAAPLATLDKLAEALIPVAAQGPEAVGAALSEAASGLVAAKDGAPELPETGPGADDAAETGDRAKPATGRDDPPAAGPARLLTGYGPEDDDDDDTPAPPR